MLNSQFELCVLIASKWAVVIHEINCMINSCFNFKFWVVSLRAAIVNRVNKMEKLCVEFIVHRFHDIEFAVIEFLRELGLFVNFG